LIMRIANKTQWKLVRAALLDHAQVLIPPS
jgi:hypothetical protein